MRLGVEAALVGRELIPGDVEIVDGRVANYGLASDNGSGIASPGLRRSPGERVRRRRLPRGGRGRLPLAGEALLETGVTAFLPTFITAPEEQLVAALSEVPINGNVPRILGVHLEGPFLAPSRLGTHPAASRRDPDRALLERLLAAGPVRLVTLAPELPGADVLIDLLQAHGVTVSCGHTDANAREANAAFDLGVHTVTHLFNAMRPFNHRDPGIAGVALARDDVIVQVIVDGVHLAPDTAKLIWRIGGGRVALVTDAMAGAGTGDGSYSLGGLEVEIRDGVARGPDGVLAGSSLTMIEAVRNLHELGVPLADALDAATAVPASVIGATDVGRIEVGSLADVVVLDDNLEVERVLVGGSVRAVV